MKSMVHIARYTILEAYRSKVFTTTLLISLCILAISFFIQELAITDSLRFQVTFFAGFSRLSAMFIVSLYILLAIHREFNDKGLDLLLALALPRWSLIAGKLLGFFTLSFFITLLFCAPLYFMTSALAALAWSFSLLLELLLISTLSLFCAVTCNQFLPATALVLGYYFLARNMNAIELMSLHAITAADSSWLWLTQLLVKLLTYVVPALDLWTSSSWLVNTPPSTYTILLITTNALIISLVLFYSTLFDFYRRNI